MVTTSQANASMGNGFSRCAERALYAVPAASIAWQINIAGGKRIDWQFATRRRCWPPGICILTGWSRRQHPTAEHHPIYRRDRRAESTQSKRPRSTRVWWTTPRPRCSQRRSAPTASGRGSGRGDFPITNESHKQDATYWQERAGASRLSAPSPEMREAGLAEMLADQRAGRKSARHLVCLADAG
jgi:hypothetical protein